MSGGKPKGGVPGAPLTQRGGAFPSAHLCVAGPDVVYRRLHSRVLRDGSGLVCRLLSVSQTSGHHLSCFLKASIGVRRHLSWCTRCGRASPHFSRSSATACSIVEAFYPFGWRWLAHGMSAHCRIGATHGKGRQRRFGYHAVADGHRPSPLLRLAVGVAPGKQAIASEQMHLIHLLATLPARSLLVTGRRLYRLRH